MAHRISITKTWVETRRETREVEVLDRNLFVTISGTSHDRAIGIYAEPYDFGESKKGFTYRCWLIDKNSIQKFKINDWSLQTQYGNEPDPDRELLIQIITEANTDERKPYDHAISEGEYQAQVLQALHEILPSWIEDPIIKETDDSQKD